MFLESGKCIFFILITIFKNITQENEGGVMGRFTPFPHPDENCSCIQVGYFRNTSCVFQPCISPSLMLQSPEPAEGVSITTLVSPDQYSVTTDVNSKTLVNESARIKPQQCEKAVGPDADGKVLPVPEMETDDLTTPVQKSDTPNLGDIAFPEGATNDLAMDKNDVDSAAPEIIKESLSPLKSRGEYLSSTAESVSENKTADIKKSLPLLKSRGEYLSSTAESVSENKTADIKKSLSPLKSPGEYLSSTAESVSENKTADIKKSLSPLKSRGEYLSSTAESVSENKTADIKSSSMFEPRKSKSKDSANLSQPTDSQFLKMPENMQSPVVRAKSEPRAVKPQTKAPPAFQFDQLFKQSAKITKPKVPSSPDTPESGKVFFH
jgi:hypothetical protein